MREADFVAALKNSGARVFIVGGWVRDQLRGVKAHDKDYLVVGIEEQRFAALFPMAEKVGKSFPVYLVAIDGKKSEVAFARKERKIGSGYCGFSVEYDSSVTLEEDLYRRDTTINSLAMELPEKKIHDLYGGAEDIRRGIIRAISKHFCEDPVRALRAARQAAEFGYTIDDETYSLMAACREELAAEPAERLLGELRRALLSPKPSHFFRCLNRAGLLAITFPELFALIGKTQPTAFHPEGDAFEHTMLVVDKVAEQTDSVLARFAGLVHDLGKGMTPKEMEPHHYGHEERGLAVITDWNKRMTLPKDWLQAGAFVIAEHMRAPLIRKEAKIVDLLLKVDRSNLSWPEFRAVIMADHQSLPDYLQRGEAYVEKMKQVSGRDCPANYTGKKIGEWIRAEQLKIYRSIVVRSDSVD
ncbi:MAG: HD domain-containing protein [Selenomonas sp.]|uniref:HD domain-containing protein n=1 Tax=Selenomonas sp. TaxID=2053611 RepID=UPI0025FDC83D|nr:HD domain-containing protein [Selenomonas sp.]MCR5438847.1 HD domain-containing protein [Selenomonas sp.]